MKGSASHTDQPADGEGAARRPKRKCLQWHPLLANKILHFSHQEHHDDDDDDDEEEDEDIDKVGRRVYRAATYGTMDQ